MNNRTRGVQSEEAPRGRRWPTDRLFSSHADCGRTDEGLSLRKR